MDLIDRIAFTSIKYQVLCVMLSLLDDPLYTREDTAKDLLEIVQELSMNESYECVQKEKLKFEEG